MTEAKVFHMNPSNKTHDNNPAPHQVEAVLSVLASLYDKELTKDAIKLYVSILNQVSYPEIKKAVQLWVADSSNKRFPLPAELLSMVRNTDEEIAQETAAKVKVAVNKYGACYPEMLARAKNYIGEIGWQLVEEEGGWHHLTTASINLEIAEHSWKKKIKLILKNNKIGNINKSPKQIDLNSSERLSQFNVSSIIPSFNFK